MYQVKTQISFEAAHRLYDVATYSEECRDNIHGHSYKVEVIVSRDELNDAGMVVDFKRLKKIVKLGIEGTYDHSCILKKDDPLVEPIYRACKKVHVVDENPTAEWMAQEFFEFIAGSLKDVDDKLKVCSVAVQETEHNIAIYTGKEEVKS